MREILFRGKTQEHTRWIYGDLNHYMCDDGVFIAENGHSMHRVLKETVGQYTGLTDKNGNKVFEGDIVYVCYKGKNGAIVFKHGMYLIDGNGFCIDFILTDRDKELEIIGNIHDNPELLKGGDENA